MSRKAKSALKKVMAVLLAAMMLFMVTACSGGGDTQTTGEKKKIGMIWYGNTDAMAAPSMPGLTMRQKC